MILTSHDPLVVESAAVHRVVKMRDGCWSSIMISHGAASKHPELASAARKRAPPRERSRAGMIFQPAIIALLLASIVSVAMLAAAAPFAIQVIRHWDIAQRQRAPTATGAAHLSVLDADGLRPGHAAGRPAAVRLQRRQDVGDVRRRHVRGRHAQRQCLRFPGADRPDGGLLSRRRLAGRQPRRHPRAGLPAGAHQVRRPAVAAAGGRRRVRSATANTSSASRPTSSLHAAAACFRRMPRACPATWRRCRRCRR